jgi:hypothetical protein
MEVADPRYPWMTLEIRDVIRRRNRMRTGMVAFRIAKRQVADMMRSASAQFVERDFDPTFVVLVFVIHLIFLLYVLVLRINHAITFSVFPSMWMVAIIPPIAKVHLLVLLTFAQLVLFLFWRLNAFSVIRCWSMSMIAIYTVKKNRVNFVL